MPWHAILTRPRAELQANRLVRERLHLQTFYPQVWTWISHARKRQQLPRPLFPRYFFALASIHDNIYRAKDLPGVVDVVRTSNRPLTIPDPVMNELIARADPDGLVRQAKAAPNVPAFTVGQYHHLRRNGPLHDLIVQIAALDNNGNVKVWLKLLGDTRETRVKAALLGEPVASPGTATPIAKRSPK